MPARAVKRKGKWRVVEPDGKLVRNEAGTPVDGGGHDSEALAKRQATAVNMPRKRKGHTYE